MNPNGRPIFDLTIFVGAASPMGELLAAFPSLRINARDMRQPYPAPLAV